MTLALEEQAQAVGATSSTVAAWAAELTSARSGLALAGVWLGPAADAAAEALDELDTDARVAEETHTRAADALRRCAADLEHAAALQRRAEALHAQDQEEQSAAARARAVLRAATTVGPPLPPYSWDDASALAVASRRLSAEAEELAQAALRRAATELDGLRPRGRRLSLGGQLLGVGRGAWTTVTDTARMLELVHPRDPRSWWRDFTATERGLLESARHPLGAVESFAGVDQLRDGAYGEWLGGLLAGAVIPGGRGGRLGGRGGGGAIRLVDRGGPVRIRPGLRLPAAYPAHIADLEPARRTHILDGDGPTSGGHRAGTGKPGKTEFPASWSDDDIIDRVMQTAMRPDRVLTQEGRGTLLAVATHHGVRIEVAVTPDGRVVTAYPTPGGAGVIDSLRRR